MNYIVYNITGEILRTVQCPSSMKHLQVKEGESMIEGTANDLTQKIADGKVVDKTPEEIAADDPPALEIPAGRRPVQIIDDQWQDVLNRLSKLETKT